MNSSTATIIAAQSYVLPSIDFLKHVGSSGVLPESKELPAQTLCVFLSQELERRSGNTELLTSVVDTLILWALDDTDPAEARFCTEQQIHDKICQALPAAKSFIGGTLRNRLTYLTRKDNTASRQINYHPKLNGYCLPFETRTRIAEENVEDSLLKTRVSEQFRIRLSGILPTLPSSLSADYIVGACHAAVTGVFESQGLEVATFFEEARSFDGRSTLDEHICVHLEKNTTLTGALLNTARGASLEILRQAFYESSPIERTYFQKLSRTYTLLFTLQNEPNVASYFKQMTGKFVLYVGSDIIIRAISEHYLAPEDQMTRNLFKVLRGAKSKLLLSEKTLGEVLGNLRKSRNEYELEWRNVDRKVDLNIASQAPLILLRAYFYAKLDDSGRILQPPRSFSDYVEQFVSYGSLRDEVAHDELREYICKSFGMDFETSEVMEKSVDLGELTELASKIAEVRYRKDNQELLAHNDALQILRVFSRRTEMGERPGANPFGYSTWWLTQESQVLKATTSIYGNKKPRFLMRPEFLLTFIATNPSFDAVVKSFKNIFPSLLGVRLSNRMKESDFRKIIHDANKAFAVDQARSEVILSQLSDRIKSETIQTFDKAFSEPIAVY